MAASGKGYRISQQDMEASRLVFVSMKDAKPRRKVAVPLPDGCTWEHFCQQVQTKLKLAGIGQLTLAQTGESITSVDTLQDIDELYVTEAVAAQPMPSLSTTQQRAASGQAASTSAPALSPSQDGGAHAESTPQQPLLRNQSISRQQGKSPRASEEPEALNLEPDKYARRMGFFQRMAHRVLPRSVLSQPLPLTRQDLSGEGRGPRRRRRRRSVFSLRNLLSAIALAAMLATMLLLYSRMTPQVSQ